MLKYIEEFKKYVLIAGLKNVEIENPENFLKKINEEKMPSVEVQFFDANRIATWQHLYFAVLNALTAFKNERNISKSMAMEMLLYASAQRQIKRALENLGIKPKTSNAALVIFGDRDMTVKSTLKLILQKAKAKRDDTVLEVTNEKIGEIRKVFGISDLELETIMKKDNLKMALVDIVLERMALLTTRI